MNPANLVQRAAACGYALVVRDGMLCPVPTRAERIMPPALLAALKANKDSLVRFLTVCRVCGRDVSDPEDRERLADPLYCQNFGGPGVTDHNGVFREGTGTRCPYKT